VGVGPGGKSGVYHLLPLEAVEVLLLAEVVHKLQEGWHSGQIEGFVKTLLVEDCNQSLETVRH